MNYEDKTKQVLAKIQGGYDVQTSCDEVGITYSTFNRYRKKLKSGGDTTIKTYNADKPKRKYTKPSAKPKTPNRLIALVGSPDEVIAALRSLT